MTADAIAVAGLGKRYRLGELRGRPTLVTDAAVQAARWVVRRAAARHPAVEELWALRDVSLTVGEGERVGVIGRNGSGKSTLLKILARVTEPTTGEARVRGRVGAVIDVGTGFHPELTGRENVFLNGAVLGMSRGEIRRKFDDIVAFSEVEAFLDTPLKRYSSGVKVRLAFSVAAHLEPEILLIDEVLAVGDAEFQRRCLSRMQEIGRSGRTVLFVSHNLSAVEALCDRAVWLDSGRVVDDGAAPDVAAAYFGSRRRAGTPEWLAPPRLARDRDLVCRGLVLRGADGVPRATFARDEPVVVELDVESPTANPVARVGFELATQEGVVAFRAFHDDGAAGGGEDTRGLGRGRWLLRATIPSGLLNAGLYSLNLRVALHGIRWHAYEDDLLQLEIESRSDEEGRRPGVVRPALVWEREQVGVRAAAPGARTSY